MRLLLSILLSWLTLRATGPETASPVFWWSILAAVTLAYWLVLGLLAFGLTMLLAALLNEFRDYLHENRTKRLRLLRPVLLWGGRLSALLLPRSRMMHMIRSALTDYYRFQSDWNSVLSSAAKQVRGAQYTTQKVGAYNQMLEAMAVLQRAEAFSLTFATVESEVKKLHDKAKESDTDDDTNPDSVFKLLYWANYWRAVLAYYAADFRDAQHWLERAAKLDEEQITCYQLAAEIAALEGDDQKAFAQLKCAQEASKLADTLANEMMQKLKGTLNAKMEGAAPVELDDKLEELRLKSHANQQWTLAWTEFKVAFWLNEAGRMKKVFDAWQLEDMPNNDARVQWHMARSMLAAMHKEGYKTEAPYADALGLLEWKSISPHVRSEIPLLRGVAQWYRNQPEPAIKKLEEMLAEPLPFSSPLYQAIAQGHIAICWEKMGKPSKGKPAHETARNLLADGSRLKVLKLAKKVAA
jgi:hypothetical protein